MAKTTDGMACCQDSTGHPVRTSIHYAGLINHPARTQNS
jgi:hypothetical protein